MKKSGRTTEGTNLGQSSDSPSVDELTSDLGRLVTAGLDPVAVTKIVGRLVGTSRLGAVRTQAPVGSSDEDLAAAIVRSVESVIASIIDDDARAGYEYLLGTGGRALRLSPDARRRAAVSYWFDKVNPPAANSFYKRGQLKYLRSLAFRLIEADKTHALLRAHSLLSEGTLEDRESFALVWLDRFEYYFRIFSPVGGIGNDLTAYLERRSREPEDPALGAYIRSLNHFIGYLGTEIDRFLLDRGGLWILSTPERSERIPTILYDIIWHLPIGRDETSILAAAYAGGGPNPTIDYVNYQLDTHDRAHGQTERWQSFMDDCRCDLDAPDSNCQVHIVIARTTEYQQTMDEEWYRIASWYLGTDLDVIPNAAAIVGEKYRSFEYEHRPSRTDDDRSRQSAQP